MNSGYVLGFVGAGFVGGAMIRAFSGHNPLVVYDKGKDIGSLKQVCKEAEIIFIALPTPMRKDGSCDTRLIEKTLKKIDKRVDIGIEVVLRSTVPPAFFRRMDEKLENVELLYMPEFLTERTADLDFITAPRYIAGSRDPNNRTSSYVLNKVLRDRFPNTRVENMTWEEASLVKYATNVFFTVKLSYMNELYQVGEQIEHCDPEKVIAELINDGRIGRSHYQVPGHDGDRGWGGHCFPKDNRAYARFAQEYEVMPIMADAAWDVNDEVRSNRDWEEQVGRAVSED